MQHAVDADARLIPMQQATSEHQLSNALNGWSQLRSGLFHPAQQCAFRDRCPTHFCKHVAGPSHRKQLSLMQIHRQGLNVRSILHGSAHAFGERSQGEVVTSGTTHSFYLMFSGQQSACWQIQDLAVLGNRPYHFVQTALAPLASKWAMGNDVIGMRNLQEGVSRMTRLASCWFGAGWARIARAASQPIARWWLTRRSAVFGQALFQLLHLRFELLDLLSQREQFGNKRLEQFVFFSDRL